MQPEHDNAARRRSKWSASSAFPILAVVAIGTFYLAQSCSGRSSVIAWGHDLPAALTSAADKNTSVLISFSSPACTYCRQMEKEVIPRDAVRAEIAHFVPVKIDAWADPRTAEQYDVQGLPAYVVATADGAAVASIAGFTPAEPFMRFLRDARKAAAAPVKEVEPGR